MTDEELSSFLELEAIAENLFHAIHCGDDKCRIEAEEQYRMWCDDNAKSV